MDTQQRKDMIRRQTVSRRSAVPAPERGRLSALIGEAAAVLPEVADARSVLAYVAVRSEVETRPLIEHLLADGTDVLLPYVAEDGAMRATQIGSLDELAPGYRGIPEPRSRFPVDPGTVGVVLVPGVAFDATGARLGYGGGFFDRFLSAAPGVPRIGLCFELQLIDEVPTLPHDEPVDVIVTEERVIRPPAPR